MTERTLESVVFRWLTLILAGIGVYIAARLSREEIITCERVLCHIHDRWTGEVRIDTIPKRLIFPAAAEPPGET